MGIGAPHGAQRNQAVKAGKDVGYDSSYWSVMPMMSSARQKVGFQAVSACPLCAVFLIISQVKNALAGRHRLLFKMNRVSQSLSSVSGKKSRS
jgi:hypothetical protein